MVERRKSTKKWQKTGKWGKIFSENQKREVYRKSIGPRH